MSPRHLLHCLTCRVDGKTRAESWVYPSEPFALWDLTIDHHQAAHRVHDHSWLKSSLTPLLPTVMSWIWEVVVGEEGEWRLHSLSTLLFPHQRQHACLLICWFVAFSLNASRSAPLPAASPSEDRGMLGFLSLLFFLSTQQNNSEPTIWDCLFQLFRFKQHKSNVWFLFNDKQRVKQHGLFCFLWWLIFPLQPRS